MKTMPFYIAVIFACFITFSPKPKINSSEIETIKIDRGHIKEREKEKVNKYGRLVFNQTDKDLKFTSLAMAVIRAESDFNHEAVSHKGALGLMQLMPETASEVSKDLGLDVKDGDLFDPEINIKLGVSYIKHLRGRLSEIDDDERKLALILASYNSGPHRVKRAFGCRGYKCYIDRANICTEKQFNKVLSRLPEETRLYLKSVKSHYTRYKKVFNTT